MKLFAESKAQVLNCHIDNLTMSETLKIVQSSIDQNKSIHHVVVNAGKLVAMQEDEQLARSVNESDLINADGMAVVWASRILGNPLKERVAGIDLMESLVRAARQNGNKIFFFGAKEEIVKKVVDTYTNQYTKDIIAGYRHGYFDKSEEAEIAKQIAESKANILFVAISSPTKENFLYENREILKSVNFTMGVGGSFDVVSGMVKRAPVWMQNAGLEWFYRFIQEPKRMWKRYLIGNSKFVYFVLLEKLGLRRSNL